MIKDCTMQINYVPFHTLWVAIVAERLGFDHDKSLTLGSAYQLYEPFRPDIPDEAESRGAKGNLDLAVIPNTSSS